MSDLCIYQTRPPRRAT